MNAAVGLMDGLGLDGDRCIRVIPRHIQVINLHNTMQCVVSGAGEIHFIPKTALVP